ncbi:MAG: SRPBCC family protein [Janthinobacterium lividum]
MTTRQEKDGSFTLADSLLVQAPIERCFELSCCLELVHEELGMNAVSGKTEGFVVGGDIVRWEGWQLGLKHFHVSHISGFERPVFMQDTMLDGRFKTFQHDHHFCQQAGAAPATLLQDELRFSLPFGALGGLVARTIMVPHIHKLMASRFARIKRIAESEDWRRYLPAAA